MLKNAKGFSALARADDADSTQGDRYTEHDGRNAAKENSLSKSIDKNKSGKSPKAPQGAETPAQADKKTTTGSVAKAEGKDSRKVKRKVALLETPHRQEPLSKRPSKAIAKGAEKSAAKVGEKGSSKASAKGLGKALLKGSGKKKSGIKVRCATINDTERLVELNRAAYPTLAEDDVVWDRRHLESHLRSFPEGQGVIEVDGKIVASCSSLIVNFGRDPYRDHTWAGITDNGMFYNHDPFGDTLYGADVNCHPDYRGRGLAKALYNFRKKLCQRLNLKRIVLGGRLYNYHRHCDEMSAYEYARKVEAGELKDPVLGFQLKQGYTLKKVLANYLPDPLSLNNASFLEWFNPEFKPRLRKPRAVRVCSVQYQMRRIKNFKGFSQQIRYFVDVAAGYGADFVLFPELLTAQLMSYLEAKTPIEAIRRLTELTDEVDELFQKLASEFQIIIIGGTHPIKNGKRIENVASMYLIDGTICRQPKIHITPSERKSWGIEGGNTLQVFDTPKAKVGILICYDSEFPEAARYLCDQGAEVIFVPFCTDDRQAYYRVRHCCQARAIENQVYVAMAGTVGNLPDVENMDIQYAQSAVLSPCDFEFARDGILVEASPNIEMVVTTDLDFEALQDVINAGSVRQRHDRRPDLFTFKAHFDPS
ncbi:MAG: bifunctional GNAT family N-acetyltransferase/carbon-nitrogen hydrolase family protein [Thermoanaerobaculia bacterium]|nr:bifunctional GNAT family N-acetyltransferase/carbon-nitrogen hydrolase family protein [Thermoanaerobaculia bacterium]